MSDASDHRAESSTLNSLWGEACHWAAQLPLVFGEPAMLASAGLSRRAALRCCNWLWAIEGLVRRLIIAAALALDPTKLPAARARPARPEGQEQAHRPHPLSPRGRGFRLVAFAPGPRSRPRPALLDEPRAYTHVPFPTDNLLRLGAYQAGHIAGAAVSAAAAGERAPARTPNPLHRRGRISRWDPDYRGVNPHPMHARHSCPRPPSPDRRRKAERVSSLHRLPVSTEWRRVEAEWERVLPAPKLAARIAALLRVIEHPGRSVRRLARRLQKSNLGARLATAPPPRLRRPNIDRTPGFSLDCHLAPAHALLRRDSS